jgi:hypothetical protein
VNWPSLARRSACSLRAVFRLLSIRESNQTCVFLLYLLVGSHSHHFVGTPIRWASGDSEVVPTSGQQKFLELFNGQLAK